MAEPYIQHYYWVESRKHMAQIAREMIDYARAHPVDSETLRRRVANEGRVEYHGGFVRSVTDKKHYFMEPYTRFLSPDGSTPLQVVYLEYLPKPQGIFCQLTIIDNKKEPIKPQHIDLIVPGFFDMEKAFVPVETPAHVFICALIRPFSGT